MDRVNRIIPKAEEQNPTYRKCLKCNKYVSLLNTCDEFGQRRNYNISSSSLCTCINALTLADQIPSKNNNGKK